MVTGASLILEAPAGILPYKAWYPYNTSAGIANFWSAYMHQIIAHAYGASTNAACDSLISGMMIQVCAQFAILQHRFHQLSKPVDAVGDDYAIEETRMDLVEKTRLRNCVEHHVEILHYARECNRVFDIVICLQFAISSTVLCVSVYRLSQISLTSPDFPIIIMYLMCMLTQIFILCYSGNQVTFESYDIVNGICEMDWTPLTLRTKKNLVFIIGKCLKPVNFTCGNVLPLSIGSFNQLVKLSYSAYNVLQRSSGS